MTGSERSLSVFAAARDAPNADAIVLPDGSAWTWRETAQRVSSVAEWLRQRFDSGDGTRVAFVAEARAESLLTLLALWELSWTAVPLHPRWTVDERSRYLARLGVDRALEAAELRRLDSLRPAGSLPAPAVQDAESAAALVATSGSTGGPKAVALSRRAFLASADASAARLGWRLGDRWLLSLPPAHVGGLSILTRCLLARRAVVLAPAGTFDARCLAERVRERRVSLLSLVPTMLRALLDEGLRPPACLRAVLLGGAASPPGLVAAGLAAGWPLWQSYGLTEACSQVATGPAEAGPGAPLLDGFEARVEDGVLELRGPALFSGYEPGGAVQRPGDWFRTGDLARLETRGDATWLHIAGRADDVIVSGGENVHPAEVEAALLEHPQVRAACVVGLPEGRWGQVVAAAVVTGEVSAAELEAFLRERLATFRVPRRWCHVDEVPTSANGKVDRGAVRALFQS